MNNGLDKICVINQEQLSDEVYLQSLLEQACQKGLLVDHEIERIQLECLTLLAYKTERYNSGDSSSIRVEKAQSMMSSNLFTIGLWLKTYQNPDDAITALRNESIDQLYQKGRKHINTMLAAAKAVHKKLLEQLIETKNVFYRSTIADGINGFFKLYDPDFEAQEIHITADYPICNPIAKLAGIEFITAYLNSLSCENQFCGFFSADDIHHLLCGYEEDYSELLINIYEIVLTTSLGCMIVRTDPYRLDVTEAGRLSLCRIFSGQSKITITRIIQNAYDELAGRFPLSSELARYIQNSLPIITNKIEAAARQNTLCRIFFPPVFPENNPKITFSFGSKMEDDQYRKVVEEINECRFSNDKVTMIKEHIHTLADLEDVLLDADLTREDVLAVLSILSFPEIAAFSKRYRPMSDIDAFDFREREEVLRQYLHDFIIKLPQDQQNMISIAAKAMQEE